LALPQTATQCSLDDSRDASALADGCPSLADYRVLFYDFDPDEGAIRFLLDETCAYLCREHAAEYERHARGERGTHVRISYLYTNRDGAPGLSIYLDLPSADVA
jgi:hypothetical protein